MYNVGGQIGGDSDLSPQGWKYAQALPALIKENVGEDANLEASCRLLDTSKCIDQIGLDINAPEDYADCLIPQIPKEDLEIARRTRCRCM